MKRMEREEERTIYTETKARETARVRCKEQGEAQTGWGAPCQEVSRCRVQIAPGLAIHIRQWRLMGSQKYFMGDQLYVLEKTPASSTSEPPAKQPLTLP